MLNGAEVSMYTPIGTRNGRRNDSTFFVLIWVFRLHSHSPTRHNAKVSHSIKISCSGRMSRLFGVSSCDTGFVRKFWRLNVGSKRLFMILDLFLRLIYHLLSYRLNLAAKLSIFYEHNLKLYDVMSSKFYDN